MYIKKFIDRVSQLDRTPGKDLVIPGAEARMLRDEVAKLLSDRVTQSSSAPVQATTDVIISGGTFK
jgi:hypothetical protein